LARATSSESVMVGDIGLFLLVPLRGGVAP
jgi:hypothetical protein